MSELIPDINWTEFAAIVRKGKIRELKSCEVKFNGEYIFTAVIAHGDMYADSHNRLVAEQSAMRSNIIAGRNPEEILEKVGV